MWREDTRDGFCRPDKVSSRDPRYSQLGETPSLAAPSEKVDLTSECPDVQKQFKGNSCTGQSLVSAVEFLQMKHNGGKYQNWSRAFVYYNARLLENPRTTVSEFGDGGASIKAAIRAAKKYGMCPESCWEYKRVEVNETPSEECYVEGKNHRVYGAYRLEGLEELKTCLRCGWPVVFSFDYGAPYPETPDEQGFVEVPNLEKVPRKRRGSHSVMAVGYDDGPRRIFFQNSKGEDWGIKGYGSMSYEYVANGDLCRDFWTIRGMRGLKVHRHPEPKLPYK